MFRLANLASMALGVSSAARIPAPGLERDLAVLESSSCW